MKRRPVVLFLVSWMSLTTTALAQEDFGGLRVKAGEMVYVTEPSGTRLAGRVTRLSATSLFIDGREIKPADGLKIERRGDPLWDGTVIGLVAGFALGALTAMDECGIDWSFGRCALAGTGWGGAIGALIDWRHVGRTVIYVGTLRTQPIGGGVGQRPSKAIEFRVVYKPR